MELNLKQKVYDGIIDRMVKGEILPGSIITEKQVIDYFNVSKSPVREAMLELCKDDVLKVIPRCGYQVNQVSTRTVFEIIDVRLMIELANFRDICKKITNVQIDQIFSKIEEIQKTPSKPVWMANDNNQNFHLELIKLSSNEVLVGILKKLLELYSRAYAQMYEAGTISKEKTTDNLHTLFLNAWKERNYEEAEKYLREDIISSLEQARLLKY